MFDGAETASHAVNAATVSHPTVTPSPALTHVAPIEDQATLRSPLTRTTSNPTLSLAASILQNAIDNFPLALSSATSPAGNLEVPPLDTDVNPTVNSASAIEPSNTGAEPGFTDTATIDTLHENSALAQPSDATIDVSTAVNQVDCTKGQADDDVVMQDSTTNATPSLVVRNDADLPAWLAPMIKYLRTVVEDPRWQDMVTEFVEFEKRGPSNGVSSCFS